MFKETSFEKSNPFEKEDEILDTVISRFNKTEAEKARKLALRIKENQ